MKAKKIGKRVYRGASYKIQGVGQNTFNDDGRPICKPTSRRVKGLQGPVHPGFEGKKVDKKPDNIHKNAYGVFERSTGLNLAPQTHDVHKSGRKSVTIGKVRKRK